MTDKPWFAARRYGLGAAYPIAWQGWLLIAGFAAFVGLAVLLLSSVAAIVALVLPAAILMVITVARKTRGGWRWRWGNRD